MSKLSVRKFGVGVASLALVVGMGVSAQAAPVIVPGDPAANADRLAGKDRVLTSVEVAKSQYPYATTVYVVGYDAVVDAAVSGVLDAPVVIMPATVADQEKLGTDLQKDFPNANKLVAIGGKGVVSEDAIKALKKNWTNINSDERLDGANRFETAVAVNMVKFKKSSDVTGRVMITRGDTIVDALAAGALKGSPVLLINKEGKVNEKVVEYYRSLGEPATMVLGGTGAIADAQVAQLFSTVKTIDPWTHAASEPELKANVQKAAALYLGQGTWQKGANTITEYFGLASAATPTDTDSPADINLAGVAVAGNGFVGYKAPAEALAKLKANMTIHVNNLQSALNDAVKAATDNGSFTVTELGTAVNAPGGNGAAYGSDSAAKRAQTVLRAFKDLYGVAPVLASANAPVTASDLVLFDGTNGTAKFVGLKGAAVNKKVADDVEAAASANKTAATSAIAALSTGSTAYTAASTNDTINWVAAQKLLDKYIDSSKKNADNAKAALDKAVSEYRAFGEAQVVTSGDSGVQRIAGADRFDTAALLSYWATNREASLISESTKPSDNLRVFLASGNDKNLIDAVVAGQLLGGQILLVPATGALPKSVDGELKRIAKSITPAAANANAKKVVAVGGTGAISDEIVIAAAKNVRTNTPGYVAPAPVVPTYAAGSIDLTVANTAVTKAVSNSGSLTTGASYSIIDITDSDSIGAVELAKISITVNSSGLVSASDSGLTSTTSKTVKFKVRATKEGQSVDSAELTLTTKRS